MTGIDTTTATEPAPAAPSAASSDCCSDLSTTASSSKNGNGRSERTRRRYSLSKIFLNFYLLAMGSFVALAFVADFVISTALQGITDEYARRFMRGTIVLIEESLYRYPKAQWPEAIKQIDSKFSYNLGLVQDEQIRLPDRQLQKLDMGDIAIDDASDRMYHRLKNTGMVLVIGPLSANQQPDYERAIPLELRIRLLTWGLFGLFFGLALWLWIRPIWRDLEAIRQTARSLEEGRFDARAPAARSRLFELLAETLNGMAERIQRLIAYQKEMSSAISHELRTPIARLRFALEMLGDAEEQSERQRLGQMMEADLIELDNLIDSSLTYARFEREQPELHLSLTTVSPWIEAQVDGMRILGRHLQIVLDLSNLPADFAIDLDKKLMPHALGNLLRNAVKYASHRILVSAELIGDRLAIHVDDDGIGVPEEDREHVFSAFTRLDRSRDRASGGYGLGLAIARQVLELHGGTARAGTSPMGGARFTLCWPRRR